MDTDAVVVEYRGYWLIQQVCSGEGTSRILRPDGSWRESEPSFVDGSKWIAWVIGRRTPNGDLEELAAVNTYDEARRWVDARLAPPK